METTIKNETKQVKTILKNIKAYALKNGCEFTKTKIKACDLQDNQPKDLVNYFFCEHGLILNFNVSFKDALVYIEEYSETSDINQSLSFKEFIKFQSHFLKSDFVLNSKKHKRNLEIEERIKLFKIKPLGFDIKSKETTLFYKYDDIHNLWNIAQDLNDLFITTYVWCQNCVFDIIETKHKNVKNLNDDDVYLCVDVILK